MMLGDYRSLTLNVVNRLTSVTRLFPNSFNDKFCDQMMVRNNSTSFLNTHYYGNRSFPCSTDWSFTFWEFYFFKLDLRWNYWNNYKLYLNGIDVILSHINILSLFFYFVFQLNVKPFLVFAATPAEMDGGCCNNTQRRPAQWWKCKYPRFRQKYIWKNIEPFPLTLFRSF